MMDFVSRFLELIPNPVVITNEKGKILQINKEFCKVSGYEEDELLGQTLSLFKSGNMPEPQRRELWRSIKASQIWRGQIINRRKDGSTYRVDATIGPADSESGKPRHYIGIFTDVTEKERIKNVLSLQANLLGELSQRIPGLIFQLQRFPNGRACLPYASATLPDFFACQPPEVLHNFEPIEKVLHPDDAPAFHKTLEASATHLAEWEYDFRVCLPNGKTRWYSGRAAPERLQDDSTLWHGYISDITRLKQTEAELETQAELARSQNYILQRAQKEAGEASRIKSQFLSNISHELRTPMNGILGATTLLAESPLNVQQEENLEILKTSSNAMMEVINSILDFSKLESKNLSSEESSFNVAQLFEEVCGQLRLSAERKGLTLEFHVQEKARVEVQSDSAHIKQILHNIGQNAVKFTEAGTIQLSLEIIGDRGNRKVFRFTVSDTGIGIPEDKLNVIFEPFAQADDSNTRRYGGTGLGLATSRMLAESLDGQIRAESTPGSGSSFFLELPLRTNETLEGFPGEPGSKNRAAKNNKAGTPSILLVEDDVVNRMIIERLVRKFNYQIITANHGLEAIKRVREQSFALILMDCQMPIMDGFEATRRIRNGECGKCSPNVPILAITALALDGDEDRCLSAGMDAYLPKPVRKKQLQESIRTFLG